MGHIIRYALFFTLNCSALMRGLSELGARRKPIAFGDFLNRIWGLFESYLGFH